MRKITPYNTSKVLIGSRYEPIKRHTMSLDEERIQDLLINPPQQPLSLPHDRAIYALCVVALVVVWFVY